MISFLVSLLPESYLPLIIVGGAIAIILGLVSVRAFLGFFGLLLLFIIMAPFIESFVNTLPTWILLLICVWLGFFILRTILTLLLGEHGSGTFMGYFFYDIVRLPFILIRGIFRFLISLFSAVARNVQDRRTHIWVIAVLLPMLLILSGHANAKSPAQTVGSAAAKRIAGKISTNNLKPKVYYHATNKSAAKDIVEKGFSNKKMNPKARLGKGIYLSDSKKLAIKEKPKTDAVVVAKDSKYLQMHMVDVNKLDKNQIKKFSKDYDLRGNIRKGVIGPKLGHKLGNTAGETGHALKYKSAKGNGSSTYIPYRLYRQHPRIIKPEEIEKIY